MVAMERARKLCLLGHFSVGKTSLIRRYIDDDFSADYHATVGVQAHKHQSEIETDEGIVRLDQVIWDVEGSKLGKDLFTNYILGSSGVLVVGDVTRDDAIRSMASHARKFQEMLPGRPFVFALNKIDLVAPGKRPDGAELIEEFDGHIIQTSALTGEAVTTLFHALCRRILEIGA